MDKVKKKKKKFGDRFGGMVSFKGWLRSSGRINNSVLRCNYIN